MADPTIKINPTKPCELEFDVTIQGLEDSAVPNVRFVLGGKCGFETSFPCDKNDDEKWVAKMPALPHLTEGSVPFRVEVIVDGYYFEPAQGIAQFVKDPVVKFQPSASKPTVTTSFTVKQETDEKEETSKKVTEGSSSATITGQYAPTNGLLKPEFEPTKSSVKTAQAMQYDQHIDHTRIEDISSHVVPGETTDPEPQHGNNQVDDVVDDIEDEDQEFDPRRVAENIVKNTFKGVQKPETRGTLFKRDGDGKPVVNGLDSPAKKAQKVAKAAKVREILGTK